MVGIAVLLSAATTTCHALAAPAVLDPSLQVNTVASGLNQPTALAFIGPNDFLVLEKASGQVKRVIGGVVQAAPVLDLAVNSGSERGLLGIALQPDFASTGAVHIFWTQSSTGADSSNLADVPLLGNRVDRFIWNGSTLTFDRNIVQLRAVQSDAGQPLRGNNNGGALRFGPDGKLYVVVGDVGRRGWLQNQTTGLLGGGLDDQFGGIAPDNAHFTGAILRLNPDGTTPADNPFFAAGTAIGGEVGANIQKLYAYGIRNGIGLSFDPASGQLWMAENGDDAFDEINRVTPGMDGGWTQIMGPLSRLADYKSIETTFGSGDLQQLRWPPSSIADTTADALSRLFMLPGATYSDPEFSWEYGVAPGGLGFLSGNGLGAQYNGDLFVGAATPNLDDGYLYRFDLDPSRNGFSFTDPLLNDLVADNTTKFDGTQSESLRFGTGFGVAPDIETGPDGKLYVVSLSNGAIYSISAGAAIPEPSTLTIFGAGLVALAVARRRNGATDIRRHRAPVRNDERQTLA